MSDELQSIVGDRMTTFDPEALTHKEQYKLLTGSIVPRPIALVTTIGAEGVNAAPFSFFNVLSVSPPLLMFSVGMRDGSEKDTVRNLRECPELVVHLVDWANAEKMNVCSGFHPPNVNEIEIAGFPIKSAELVRPPRIASCPVHFECVLESILPFGDVPYSLVVAKIVRMHFRENVVNASLHIDLQALDAIGRMAGPGTYVRTKDRFVLPSM